MSTNRTYGVEIEMASSYARRDLAEAIQDAFNEAGVDHFCQTNWYHHNTDGTNTTMWEVQSDGSIRTTSSHMHQVEIVSPVLKGQAGLDALKIVCQVATKYGKINTSCGLHVHHGVDSWDDVCNIARAFSRYQDVIYKGLPSSRSSSHYCQKWECGPLGTQIRRARTYRYTGLNLCSYSLRKTVEFRCAAGTTEFKKISNWILFTQGLVEAAIAGRTGSAYNLEGLVQFVGGGVQTSEYASIRRRQPSKRSKCAKVLNRLISQNSWSRDTLVRMASLEAGCSVWTAQNMISASLSPEHNTLKGEVIVENGIFRFADEATVTSTDPDYQQAAEWFRGRYNHFQNAA